MSFYFNSIQQVSITITAGTSNTAVINPVGSNAFVIWQNQTAVGTGNDGATCQALVFFSGTTATAQIISSGTVTVKFIILDPGPGLVTGVQTGTIQLNNVTSNTATITSVNTGLSAVFYAGGNTGLATQGLFGAKNAVNLTLTNATTVTAKVATANASVVNVAYYVVTFAAAAIQSLQQFSVTETLSSSNTQIITSVTTGNTMIAWGGINTPGGLLSTSPWITLTNATTVTLTSTAAANYVCNFTVIEFVSGVLTNAQRGSVATSVSTSGTATLGTSVTTANSFCSYLGATGAGITDATDNCNVSLTNSTTVTTNVNTAVTITAGYEVVQFNVVGGLIPFPWMHGTGGMQDYTGNMRN